MMKTAISVPDDLFEAAERLARRLGLSRSALYQAALRRFVEERAGQALTEALDAVYTDDVAAEGLDAELARLQAASVGAGEPEAW